MANPTGINQYSKIGGNRVKTKNAIGKAKQNKVAANKHYLKTMREAPMLPGVWPKTNMKSFMLNYRRPK